MLLQVKDGIATCFEILYADFKKKLPVLKAMWIRADVVWSILRIEEVNIFSEKK